MTPRPKVLEHLGDYVKHPPVEAFGGVSDRAYGLFHDLTGGHEKAGQRPRDHLVTRLMYMAETTSTALRLNVSWALSIPGMSLTRDRYEQVVRFSWLARQADHGEMIKFLNSHYAKSDKIFKGITPEQLLQFDVPPTWMGNHLTNVEAKKLSEWESLDLRSMAAKRDGLCPADPSALDKETLLDVYVPVYQQFSSVSHCDMYGVNMLGLHKAPSGQLVLAPDPSWPAMLCAINSLFDLIQCHEAAKFLGDRSNSFEELLGEWKKFNSEMAGLVT